MIISKKVNKYWFSYFLIKLFYLFFAVFIYSKITVLGDTSVWMDSSIKKIDLSILTTSTYFMDFFGGISSIILGSTLGNLPFMFLAFYGIYYSVSKLKITNKQLFVLLFLLSLPSFGVWSSIAGKESIGVFFMGIILGYIIDILELDRFRPKVIEIIAFYLLCLFKPQYLLAVISIIIFIFISRKLNLKASGKLFLLLLHITLAGGVLYIYKDIINELSFIMPIHFSLDAGSTRENTIWVNDYDVFFNAPYGMFIGFWGPTFGEILKKPIQSIVFLESLIIFSFFIYFIWTYLKKTLNSYRLNIYMFSLMFIVITWLLFVHYPFGVLNPGSALRYRENFYGFLVVFLFYLYSKYIFKRRNL